VWRIPRPSILGMRRAWRGVRCDKYRTSRGDGHDFFLPRRAARIFARYSARVSAIAARRVSNEGNFPSAFSLTTSAANSVGPIFGSFNRLLPSSKSRQASSNFPKEQLQHPSSASTSTLLQRQRFLSPSDRASVRALVDDHLGRLRLFHLRLNVPNNLITQNLQHAVHRREVPS
jgi:hypothetical protein